MDVVSARRRPIQGSRVRDSDYFPFGGGLNLVDTPLTMRPGQLLACSNYEPGIRGGYTSLAGYERFDGRVAPSDASYWLIDYVNRVVNPAVGATITGGTSGATGILLFDVQNAAAGYFVLARVTGTFQDGEALQVSAVTQATADDVAIPDDAATDELHSQYQLAAQADARAQIGVVPGSGSILGVAVYRGVGYAVRNNVGGTAAVIHKSTASGWQPVALGFKLRFITGLAAALHEGDTVVGGTSGATGVIRRLVVQTGTFGAGDATGYVVIMSITGTFQSAELLKVGGTDRATTSGLAVAQTLAPGGKFEFRVHNFYGHTSTTRLYGVDGVSRAFELQDSPAIFVQIETGMTVDTPNHIAVHNDQLFLMFPGGSVQKSGVGDPVIWSVSLGAGEIAIGDEGTGFLEELGGTLFIFARNKTLYLTGKEGTYVLDSFNNDVGAWPGMIQRIGQGVYLDDRGFSLLAASQNFGNFSYTSFSGVIQPLIEQIKLSGTASVVVRDKNLFRAFFADGRFVSIGFNGRKVTGLTTSSYEKVVRCAFSGEELDGKELLLFGSDDGYVYRADKGTSFDGADIQTFMRPVFHHSRTPSRRKRYRRAQFDVAVQGPCELQIGVDYSFADPDEPGEPIAAIELEGGGGFWNVSDWNEFKWNTGAGSSAIVKLEGSGINIGFLIASRSAVNAPHSLQGVSLHHSQRRINRGTSNA